MERMAAIDPVRKALNSFGTCLILVGQALALRAVSSGLGWPNPGVPLEVLGYQLTAGHSLYLERVR